MFCPLRLYISGSLNIDCSLGDYMVGAIERLIPQESLLQKKPLFCTYSTQQNQTHMKKIPPQNFIYL